MDIEQIRKENLDYLINRYGSQSALARQIKPTRLSQATLSDIIVKGRLLSSSEARDIEKSLNIPKKWLDKNGWIQNGWNFVIEYGKMDTDKINFFNDLIDFTIAQNNKGTKYG